MAGVVVFHHALGLTPGITAFAAELRRAGHTVYTPDLFEGRTFPTLEDGVRYAEQVGFGEVIGRGVRAVEQLPTDVVYAGFSLGVLPAQMLTQTRPGARGALFYYSCVPVSEFGVWPEGVPVQVHGMDADPIFVGEGDIDAARELVASTAGGGLFLYPGDQHYFLDPTLPSYDAGAAALVMQRTLALLRSVE
jgi:dienelactone hydrolase